MTIQFKKVGFVLIVTLLLASLFTTIALAQGCPSDAKIYFNAGTGNDETGNGTADSPFKTFAKSIQVSNSCTRAGGIYENGVLVYEFSPYIPPGTGTPLVQMLFVGGLIVLAVLFIGAALIIGRRSSAVPS